AAVDSRVKGIAPAVYDKLGLTKQMEHQLEAWRTYSPQIADYTRRGLQQELETEIGQKLVDLVDPYSYLDKITVPKLIMIGTNDPYWPLDALHLYQDQLSGPVNQLYVPNTGHGIDNDQERVFGAYGVFHYQTARGLTLPRIEDSLTAREKGHKFSVYTGFLPAAEVKLWQAEAISRDFRDAEWEVIETQKNTGNSEFVIDIPDIGWRAVMAEVVYKEPIEFSLTTGVHLITAEQKD
ncbi:MAG: PhoPQ-activated protein PqaA family protein, partial [Bacillota bacterium]